MMTPLLVEKLFAWMLMVIASVVGSTMVAVGMIEEVPTIIRSTFQRTLTRRR